ncbi:tRNA1(Val) (adenine(37)-N6)-methyltransferase [Spiroplasma tabanidicola]|uniref:Methyltransferase n=1 Tax=Spiroplasma tabanidicola TaxID=324079 RepID=A0A6I6CB26_9MOLU|nr:methyltransferase [Spiroplasma tabanidicola]QGS51378.1 methyltransferase [Spiroplasma tabanidicola]
MKVLNQVLNFKDLKIFQDTKHFSFCLDSVLLAKFYIPKVKDKKICDFGTNNAIIPLLLSKYIRKDAKIYGIEIQKEACDIACENILINNLSDKIEIINEDIKTFVKDKNNFFDVIYCNPPFFKISKGSNLNKKSKNLIPARHELLINLEEIIYSAKVGLKNGGRFVMVHLAERLDEIIYLLKKNNFSLKNLRFVCSKQNQEPKKVLIDAINDGNSGIKILNNLYVHNDDESYTNEVLEIFGD